MRYNLFWTKGSITFGGPKLKTNFPKLFSICNSFGRWLSKQELVFDNTKKDLFSPYDYNLCLSGIVQKIYAFPESLKLLEAGNYL